MEAIWFTLLALAILAIGLYAAMILFAISGWQKLKSEPNKGSTIGVSILVAARNETNNIETTIENLLSQNYPSELLEVIVIDDHSEDDTLEKCNRLKEKHPRLQVISGQQGKGKKAALKAGIDQAKFPIVATVDADCRIPSEWLKTMMGNWKYETTKMLLGPVVLQPTKTLFQQVQSLEMLSIMGLTGGSAAFGEPIMANGANIIFDKSAFENIGGYTDNGNPSGDDVFTMLKFNEKWAGSVQFVKDYRAVVHTNPQESFSGFWQQRKRWLSKKSGYSNIWVKSSALITYAANVTGFAALIVCIFNFGSFWADKLLWLLVIKTILDLMLTRAVKKDLQPDCGIWNIIPAEIFIVTYVTLLGIIGNVGNYVWKGRSIKVNG
ncbi:MAG: glycosyltransferase [Flavobacteriales bacterium]|nr:glycosyltransferase [Flavobacteriales bacterium]